MLCISIFYNRQGFDTDRPDKNYTSFTPWHLIIIRNVSERPRQLLGYDVCLTAI